ncbi:MAG: F0F1 ATP synthase subunit B [Saprospiraceae bacterium]|nr:F0F1 ATP synthase subunit B [Saprospiraceae bacterium]
MTDLLFLADFSVIRPEPGLFVWTVLIFSVFWWLMAKYAFKPIQQALKAREDDIQNSLDEAKRAREEMANLNAENEKLLAQASEERAKILKEAKEAKQAIIAEAKEKAKEEAKKIVANAKNDIENLRMAAVTDLKNQVGNISIEIAEKILREQLKGDAAKEGYVKSLVDEIKLN